MLFLYEVREAGKYETTFGGANNREYYSRKANRNGIYPVPERGRINNERCTIMSKNCMHYHTNKFEQK